MDFACYGINIMTELLNGEVPNSVYAEVRNFKAQDYPQVDDESIIILNYDNCNCIIQASWNWAIPRKDMELYGTKGYAIASNNSNYKYKLSIRAKEQEVELEKSNYPIDAPLNFFKDVDTGIQKPSSYHKASLKII